MKPENGCLLHLDAVTGKAHLTPEASAHLEICPSCRQAREMLTALLRERSAWPTQDLSGLKNRIVEKIRLEPRPHGCSPAPAKALPSKIPEISWLETWIAGHRMALVAVFATIVLVIGLSFGVPDSPSLPSERSDEQHFQLTRVGGVSETRSLSETITLASETVEILGPDASLLTITGPARFQVFRRGFRLDAGYLKAQVKPGNTVFSGRTPHGEIVVLGTIFLCRVTEACTDVRVEEGKVRIVSVNGPERILVAGQAAGMLYSGNAGTPGEIRENPAVESDPSQ